MASPAEPTGGRGSFPELRIGLGTDVHAFAADRRLWLGCVEIDHRLGLAGHSDADVLVHAVVDALLGAMGLRDIGVLYPPGEPRWAGYPGRSFLADMNRRLAEEGWELVNLDCVVMAERPKLSPYIPEMIRRMAEALGVAPGRVNVKATTAEGLGFTGREEGILAQAVALLRKANRSGSPVV
jgi:2-C-methyl-D-erythritol 2,4-cyclodiphosphate synthase